MFASNSRFMRLFQAPLDTCLDSLVLARLSIHGLHFMVYMPSIQECKTENSKSVSVSYLDQN